MCVEWWYEINAERSGNMWTVAPVSAIISVCCRRRGVANAGMAWNGMASIMVFIGLGEVEGVFGRKACRRDGVGGVSAKLTTGEGDDAGGRGGFIRFN